MSHLWNSPKKALLLAIEALGNGSILNESFRDCLGIPLNGLGSGTIARLASKTTTLAVSKIHVPLACCRVLGLNCDGEIDQIS